jgi:hypothetical protein
MTRRVEIFFYLRSNTDAIVKPGEGPTRFGDIRLENRGDRFHLYEKCQKTFR